MSDLIEFKEEKTPTERARIYEARQELYQALKDEFTAGKTIRQMAAEHEMRPIDMLALIRYIAREFEVERGIRMDDFLRTVMDAAQEAARAGKLPETKQWSSIFVAMSEENRKFLDRKGKRRAPRKPTPGVKSKAQKAEEESLEDFMDDVDD